MKYKCVSYPDFEPNHTWLRQILLFVDEVHRIVPADEEPNDSDDLKRLMEHCEGAVKRFPPRHYIEIPESQAELFGKSLDQPNFRKVADSKERTITLSGASVEVKDWEFLHIEKIGDRVRKELSSRGMMWESPFNEKWQLVPRGVGALVLGMLADQIARAEGFDAVTDQPLAFALNSLYGCSDRSSSAVTEGIIATAITKVHVPKSISLIPAKDYAELRKSHACARAEFARMVRELKEAARLDRVISPAEFRSRLDDIVEDVGIEIQKFRKTKTASKVNEWVPLVLTSLLPVAITCVFGPVPGVATGVFSFGVRAIANLTKKTGQVSYPKVLQTLCSASDAAATAALRKLA